jgi:DNA-binding IclR family transcriptional regulator
MGPDADIGDGAIVPTVTDSEPLNSPVRTAGIGSIKVVERAGRILDVLKERDTVTVGDLVSLLGDNRTTIVRLCEVLTGLGLLERAAEESRAAYRLGPETLYLGGLYRQRSRLRTSALPTLQKVADATDDTAYLIARARETGVCLARVVGDYRVASVLLEEGAALPYDRGGGSTAILAFLKPEERDFVFGLLGEGRRQAIEPRLEPIRRQGYALSLNEFIVETGALGAPVFDENGTVLGAVSVGGIIGRFSEDRLPMLNSVVVQAAYEVSRAMGFQGAYPPAITHDRR